MEIQEFVHKLNGVADIAPKSKTGVHLRALINEFNNSYTSTSTDHVHDWITDRRRNRCQCGLAKPYTNTNNNSEEQDMGDFSTYIANLEAKGLHQAAARARATRTGNTPNKTGMKKCPQCNNGFTGRDCMNPACGKTTSTDPNRKVRPTCRFCGERVEMTLTEAKTWNRQCQDEAACTERANTKKANEVAAKAAKANKA